MSLDEDRSETPDRVSRVIRDLVPLGVIAFLFAVAVRRGCAPLTNDDTFFHLRFGAEFLDGWGPRDAGSVTGLATRDWVPTQWLSQVLIALLERTFGLAGVMWLYGALIATFVMVVFWTCRDHAGRLVAAMVTVITLIAVTPGLSMRPQLMSYILVTLTVAAWLRTAMDGRIRWWLLATAWVWPMLHGMWPVGVLIGFTAALGLILDGRLDRRQAILSLSVPLLSVVAAATTPIGPGIYREIFTVGSRSKYFEEWGPTDFTDLFALVLAAMLAGVLVIHLRAGAIDWIRALLILQAGGWAIYSARTVPVAAALVAPLAAAALQSLPMPRLRVMARGERLLVLAGYAVSLLLLTVLAPRFVAAGPEFPEWVDRELSAYPEGTRVLNEWAWGGYLMWRFPDIDVVMHGYGDTFTTAELDRSVDIVRLKPGWDRAVRRIDAEVALVDPDSPLAYALKQSEGWTVVQHSRDVQLLIPPD